MPARMTDRLADWVALVDRCYPEADAQAWDAVGLQVGAPEDRVTRVLVSLDVTVEVIAEAQAQHCDLVLAHHPLLLRPLARLTPQTASGRTALAAARARVGVLAAHTNLDAAAAGTSDPVVDLLGLREVTPLRPLDAEAGVKLVTFVPAEDTAGVLEALAAAGAGVIGEYDRCSFRVSGTGTFRPSASADPSVGDRGVLNSVAEERLEVVVLRAAVPAAVAALRAAHPYEEVAFDLVPLLADPADRVRKGIGRIGDLPALRTLADLAEALHTGLPSPHLRLAGDPRRRVTRVAVSGGAGDGLVDAAARAGAEVFITGDLRHHVALDARTQGLALIDAGHHATETAALPAFAARLRDAAATGGLTSEIALSLTSTDPWADWRAQTQRGTTA